MFVQNKNKILIALAIVVAAIVACTVGAFAYFTDSASLHAGIRTTKLTGEIGQTTALGTPQSEEVWRESQSTVKDGDKEVFTALDTDIKDGSATKADIKTFTVSRGNALAVNDDGSMNQNQMFKTTFKNTSTVDEVFYPEICLTGQNGVDLSQYKDVIGIAESDSKAALNSDFSYQNVTDGTAENLLNGKIWNVDSIATKVIVNGNGSLSLYLPGITLKPGESIEKTYTVTENMSGHVDYSCPTVAVTVNATIRYASKGNPMWYGTAVSDKSDSSVQYTLGPDFQTRVLWKDAKGSYTVRGGDEAFSVKDAESENTKEALEYSVVKYEYTGTNQAPTAFLFGSDVSYTLYQQNDKGAWKKVTDSNATLLGHYKAVVDASGMNGFTVSHTSFHFDIVKIKDKVTFENKPLPDGSEDKDNNMGWPTINNGEKIYDGKAISIVAKDSHGNIVPELIFTDKETGNVVENPTEVGDYIVTPVGDEFHEYTNTGTAKIKPAPLTIKANDMTVTEGTAPTFTSIKIGFVNNETVSVLTGSEVFTVSNNNATVNADSNGCYPAGTYRIIPSGYTAKNYTITYEEGTLTVENPSVTVALKIKGDDDSKIYDGLNITNDIVDITVDDGNSVLPDGYGLVWRDSKSNKVDFTPKDVGSYTGKIEKIDESAKTWNILGNGPVTYKIYPFTIKVSIQDKMTTNRGSYVIRNYGMPIVHDAEFANLSDFPTVEKDALTEAKEAVLGIKVETDGSVTYDENAQSKYFYTAKTGDTDQNGKEALTEPVEAYYLADDTLGSIEGRFQNGGKTLYDDILKEAAVKSDGFKAENYQFELESKESVYTVPTYLFDYNAEDAKAPVSDTESVRSKIELEKVKGHYVDTDFQIRETDLPTRDGYICTGYAVKHNASEPDYAVGTSLPSITKDKTLYAVWKEIPKPLIRGNGSSTTLMTYSDLKDYSKNKAVQKMAAQAKAVQFDNSVPDTAAWTTLRDNDSVVIYLDDNKTLHICNNQNVTMKVQKPIAEPYALAGMFKGCTNLVTADMSGVDMTQAVSMSSIFENCSKLTSVKGFSGDADKMADMSRAFRYCIALNDISGLSDLNTANVNSMNDIFAGCAALEDLTPLTNWDVKQVKNANGMFGESDLPNNHYKFAYCTNLKSLHGLENWQMDSLESCEAMFKGCTSLTDISAMSNWNVSNVTRTYNMFYGCSALENLTGLESWHTEHLTYANYMFYGCSSLSDVSAIKDWDMSKLESAVSMFNQCSSLQSIVALSGWNTSSVKTIESMFNGCSALSDISGVSNWDTSSVTNMSNLFSGCTALSDINALTGWNTENVTKMTNLFNGCSSLSDVNALHEWQTGSVTDMSYMFDSTDVNSTTAFENWNVGKVAATTGMFRSCANLADLTGLKNWNTSAVTEMYRMFYGCKALTTLDGLENWDTSAVTKLGNSGYSGNAGMFEYCSSLTSVEALANWNTGAVTDMNAVFNGCSALTDATPLNGWNVASCKNKNYAFDKTGIPSDKLPTWYN